LRSIVEIVLFTVIRKKISPEPDLDARIFCTPPGPSIFFGRYRKRRHLKMIATTVDWPEEGHRRLRFEDEGRDCSFYVQETAWYSTECEQAWKSWNELFTGVSHELRGRHKRSAQRLQPCPGTNAWHWSTSRTRTMTSSAVCRTVLWVASYLQRKRTRNANCFRGTRYWVCWKPCSQPPLELSQLSDVCFLTMPASGVRASTPGGGATPQAAAVGALARHVRLMR
jgi:hypothetical protein